MLRRAARARSGITLTEILISIMIMGVGVISLATLFPLGLIRLRNAQRMSRGALLAESAISDLGTRNLLSKVSFTDSYISPWYVSPSGAFDPWVQDTPAYGAGAIDTSKTGADGVGAYSGDTSFPPTRSAGPGLPVAYDPLWRCITGIYPDALSGTGYETRFGSGIGFVRPDGTTAASVHGLQRISNLQANINDVTAVPASLSSYGATAATVRQNTLSVMQTFISPEDIVLQDPKGTYIDPNNTPSRLGSPSPVVPDMTTSGSPENDWRFTWFFTGQQSDLSNGTVFDGDVVVCENRPFGLDPVTAPYGNTYQVTGETVVEAVWGYSTSLGVVVGTDGSGNNIGYGNASSQRTVWLRWPASMPDPDVKVGGFIADVTYERSAAIIRAGRFPSFYSGQRCHWYQIAKKTEATAETISLGGEVGAYRRMTVWLTTPLRAQSLLMTPSGGGAATPAHPEAALIMPSVVNVYPRTIYTR